MSDKETIDKLLNDKEFQEMVEAELGKPIKVKVIWPENEIIIIGTKQARKMNIDETLAILRKEVQ